MRVATSTPTIMVGLGSLEAPHVGVKGSAGRSVCSAERALVGRTLNLGHAAPPGARRYRKAAPASNGSKRNDEAKNCWQIRAGG